MRMFRGKTKSADPKKDMWVEGRSGKWHRVNPTNGQLTACGAQITDKWGFPTDKAPEGADKLLCSYPECRGIVTYEGEKTGTYPKG